MDMKNAITFSIAALLLSVFSFLHVQPAQAQDELEIQGYANVNVMVKAAPEAGGKVFPFNQQATVKAWRTSWTFKQPVAVGSMFGSAFTLLFLYANPATADGYIFGGWYLDDGDGELDAAKDELLSEEAEFMMMAAISDDATIYATQAEAKAGTFPAEPTDLIFAYFTRGARVSMSINQDDDMEIHAACGSVWISKPVNEPGDQVTVRAIANDGFQFEYWQDASSMGNVVSRENPYTFTVQGGEHLYAYFTAIDAPYFDLPEEGGFAMAYIGQPWVLTDESMKAGAHVLVMESEDLTRTADGKVYLDMAKEDAHIDVAQSRGRPSLIYGKGRVRFAYKLGYNIARKTESQALVRWSGDNGATLTGDVLYVYVFVPAIGAFIQYGTTDDFAPTYVDKVVVPANLAYIAMSAFDLTDDQGVIPAVIGLSAETYDRGLADGQAALESLLAGDDNGKKGDVNGDGTVDVADISSIITVMANSEASGSGAGAAADVNADGSVDVADISAVISIMAVGE